MYLTDETMDHMITEPNSLVLLAIQAVDEDWSTADPYDTHPAHARPSFTRALHWSGMDLADADRRARHEGLAADAARTMVTPQGLLVRHG